MYQLYLLTLLPRYFSFFCCSFLVLCDACVLKYIYKMYLQCFYRNKALYVVVQITSKKPFKRLICVLQVDKSRPQLQYNVLEKLLYGK